MTNSFVLSKGKLPTSLLPLCARLTTFNGQPDIIEYENLSIAFSANFNSNFYFDKEDIIVWLLPTAFDSIIDVEIGYKIHQAIDENVIEDRIPPNAPNFLAYHKVDEKLFVFNNAPGYLPLYYGVLEDTFWLTTEAKAFIHSTDFSLKLRSYEFFSSLNYQLPFQSESIFENLYRIKSNELLVIDKANKISSFQLKTNLPNQLKWSEREIGNQLFEHLNTAIYQNVSASHQIGVALSGGYDSGSIVGILSRQNVNLNTITIGSSVANEFTESKIVADAVKVANHSKLINESDYLQTYLETIFINEINDTVIAEAFVGISELYQFAGNYCSDLFTGYGADILLGNLLHSDTENLNFNAFQFLNRCATSGEFSPFIAEKFTINVHHIYLNQAIIDFCLAIPGYLKTKNNTNKYIQKEMILEHQLMPSEILEMKKKGLHEGAGLPSILSRQLGIEDSDYRTKNKFLYNCLKMIFENGIEPNLCDVNYILHQTKEMN